MAKDDNWFKLYYRLLLISTQGWKDDEFGAYVRLLIHQFDKYGLPDNAAELSKMITSYKKNWPLLSTKFRKCEDGLLRNDFMAEIRAERDEKSRKGKEIGSKGGRPKNNLKVSDEKPKGFEKKTHIDHSLSFSNSNSLSEDDESLKEEETQVGLPEGGFFSDQLPKEMLLTDIEIGKTIQYVNILTKKTLTAGEVVSHWEAFKIRQFEIHEWYNGPGKLIGHFRDSLKNKILNGNNQTKAGSGHAKSASGKDAGAIELANRLAGKVAERSG